MEKQQSQSSQNRKSGTGCSSGFCILAALEMVASMVTLVINAAFHMAAFGVAPVSAEAADNAATSDIPVMGGGGSAC